MFILRMIFNYSKALVLVVLLMLFFFSVKTSVFATNTVSQLPNSDTYKSIVKIKAFSLDEDYFLTPYSQGSGIIINSSGLVLTNNHVVTKTDEFDDSENESVYQICLSQESISEEPDCSYTAELVAKDKDSDIALLKIKSIPELSRLQIFPYLDLNQSEVSVNAEVTVLGYPAIGGDTITISKGIISGKSNKYNKKWIKTDAVTSFGSSGGAAVDASGKVVGITSAAHSDMLGSLGYIIDITSVGSWIAEHQNQNPLASSLFNRLVDYTKRERSLRDKSIFQNNDPALKLSKPVDWQFKYEGESALSVSKESDEEGGGVGLIVSRAPYLFNVDNIEPEFKRQIAEEGLLSVSKITKQANVTINGQKGKKLTLENPKQDLSFYIFPYRNYLISLMYDYGKDDKDKPVIDSIINSIKFDKADAPFKELKQFTNIKPKFIFEAIEPWSIKLINSKAKPLEILNKKIKQASARINMQKINASNKNFDNANFLKDLKDKVQKSNRLFNILDLKIEIKKTDLHYKLNKQIFNVLKVESIYRKVSSGEILNFSTDYLIRNGDFYIEITLNVLSSDRSVYNRALKDFNNTLTSFRIK